MSENVVFSVSMSEEAVAWIESQSDNRSQFLENLVIRDRDGYSEVNEAIIDQEIKRAKKQTEAKQADWQAEKNYLQSLKEKKAELDASKSEYRERLTQLLDEAEEHDSRIFEDHGKVIGLSNEFEKAISTVMRELKQQAAEEHRELTNYNFMEAREARQTMEEEKPIWEVVDDE